MPLFESIFRLPDSYLFFTPEERVVVENRFRIQPVGRIVGIGINLEPVVGSTDGFRRDFGLGEDPYLVYVGRLDPMKGVKQLCDFFIAMKTRRPSSLKLVLAGESVTELPEHDDIIVTGFLKESVKHAAISGSIALIQSSYFESFSIVLCEAWVQRRPALVQGASTVLRGQAMRSGGAIPYEGFAEFESAVEILLENPEIATEMGENGYSYVKNNYEWSTVLKGFEESLEIAAKEFKVRPITLGVRK